MDIIELAKTSHWAIDPVVAQNVMRVVMREGSPIHAKPDNKVMAVYGGERPKQTRYLTVIGNVAVLEVTGAILPRANLFDSLCSDAVSLELLKQDIEYALKQPSINNILLYLDSPGGQVAGVHEFAAYLRTIKKKPIESYVMGTAASAAYWIASATSRITLDATAIVGSVGVVTTFIDDSKFLENNGFKRYEIVNTLSPDKRLDMGSDDGLQKIMETLNALADVFFADVAKNRQISVETVQNWRGGVFVGEKAIELGLADKTGSFQTVLNRLNVQKQVGIRMEDNQVITPPLTSAFIREHHPEVAKTLMHEGALAENKRLRELHALASDGFGKELDEAIADLNMTPESFAMMLVTESKKRGINLTDMRSENQLLPAHTIATDTKPESEDTVQLVKGVVAKVFGGKA